MISAGFLYTEHNKVLKNIEDFQIKDDKALPYRLFTLIVKHTHGFTP